MKHPLKILHLEDNTSDAWLIERSLKKSGLDFSITVVDNRTDFIAALDDLKPDLILSDHSLPQFDSMEALRIYKEKGGSIPFILITGSVSEEFAILSIKEGADDYILKNNLIRLPSAIDQAIKARKTVSERQEANRQLEISNRELNTFIYKAAHELRGPLCSIMGLTSIAGMESEQQTLPDYINKISESTKKLDAVLLSLIHVMTIRDATPQIREVDFKKLVDPILKKLNHDENLYPVKIDLKLDNQKGFYSDESILSSVMFNIIENAIRYRNVNTPDAYVKISVLNSKEGVIIRVEDNGIGIEPEIHQQIFEMYFRGNQFSKGSGLGLYIAKEGVKKLGGSIEVQSTLSKGSVFTIRLPGERVLM